MVEPMNEHGERLILRALEDVAEHASGSMSPNDAIVKAASDHQIPPGHIPILVQAYNTGRTTRQREAGDDPHEKSADFDLASTAEVMEALYPSALKAAAAQRRASAVSSDYDRPPDAWYKAVKQAEVFEKAAASIRPSILPEGVTVPPLPTDPTLPVKRAYAAAQRRQRDVENARREVAGSQDLLIASLTKLAAYFRTPGHLPLAEVAYNATTAYGVEGTAVLDHVRSHLPASFQKQAAYDERPTHAVNTHVAPYSTIRQAVTQVRQVIAANDHYVKLAQANVTQTAEELAPFVATTRSSSVLEGVSASPSSALDPTGTQSALGASLTKHANRGLGAWFRDNVFAAKMTSDIVNNVAQGMAANRPSKNDQINKSLQEISSPSHEQSLRDIRARAMLQDMMANDEVISGYDPTEVTEAFNGISSMVPRIANQPLYVQALLRKQLAQKHLDTFDYDNLTGTEKNLKEIHRPSAPGIGIRTKDNDTQLPSVLS